jgi:carbamoyltransferase
MKILGFNPSHHGSVCLLEDGELKFFIQEERLTRTKYDSYPFKGFIDIIQNHNINKIIWGTPGITYPISSVDKNSLWRYLAKVYSPGIEGYDLSPEDHHLSHAAHSFYNSGFKEAIGIIIDGLGSSPGGVGQETETIYRCEYPSNFQTLYKNIFYNPDSQITPPDLDYPYLLTSNINLSRVYETITMHLGWTRNEAGKTMGLAPYGKLNQNLPSLFRDTIGDKNIFYFDPKQDPPEYNPFQTETFIDEEKNPELKLSRDPKEWHYDESKITDLEKDLAWSVQNDTQEIVGNYIEKAIQETGLKQVCCAGGYFLNCVTNYYLLKRFPDVEFYFEPIANDSGTAIGAAKLVWHSKTQDMTIRPFKSLYLGKQYSKEELLEGIKKYT